ncbi:unnamed protein product [Paramecium pentaurelia]|uniref:Uncharacterized protein n=1 Tax=Paramecium pentaurelia TaxID=43138 RepID=A0A8S1YG18_9CILI|nr:unnamed protein product [Paramecium pentaurelia]
MGSICIAKQQNFASITQSDIEVAEEQAINDQISTMSCNFISTLELQFKSTTSSNEFEQQQTKKMKLSQSHQQIIKKGILKNTNPYYEEELRLLQKTIKESQESMYSEKIVNYLKARKGQGQYEINL